MMNKCKLLFVNLLNHWKTDFSQSKLCIMAKKKFSKKHGWDMFYNIWIRNKVFIKKCPPGCVCVHACIKSCVSVYVCIVMLYSFFDTCESRHS